MLTTVLMDYDSTLHDMDGVMERSLDRIMGYSGKELYHIWVYDIHRALIHEQFLDRHDDTMFHCELLFKHLNKPYNQETANLIISKFNDARVQAKKNPIYYPEAIPALTKLKEMGLKIFLSTGYDAEEKARTLVEKTGVEFFDKVFSESSLGFLKTETEYYQRALTGACSSPEETVSIGDTPLSDIRPAKLVGITTIWVNRVREPKPGSLDQIADYEVTGLCQAVEIMKSINDQG